VSLKVLLKEIRKMVKPNILAGIPSDYVPVTPNDSTDNVPTSGVIGLYVGGAGDVVITNNAGFDRTIAVTDSAYLPLMSLTRVKSTGTTATGILVAVA